MLELILKIFDLFQGTARKMAMILPQSGEDVIRMFQQVLLLANNFNLWIQNSWGVNFQAVLAPFGRLIILWLNFFVEAVKAIVARL